MSNAFWRDFARPSAAAIKRRVADTGAYRAYLCPHMITTLTLNSTGPGLFEFTEAVRGFVRGPSGLEGGLVNSSRAILFPEAGNTTEASVWERAVDAALDRAVGELGEAVAGSCD